jgi:tetratricopeptide (TPR) repeat protein
MFLRVADSSSDSVETLLARGLIEMKTRRFEEAVRSFSEALRRDPKRMPYMQLWRGEALARAGRIKEAMGDETLLLLQHRTDFAKELREVIRKEKR